jgi:hypothetical protein
MSSFRTTACLTNAASVPRRSKIGTTKRESVPVTETRSSARDFEWEIWCIRRLFREDPNQSRREQQDPRGLWRAHRFRRSQQGVSLSGQKLAPFITNTVVYLHDAIKAGRGILLRVRKAPSRSRPWNLSVRNLIEYDRRRPARNRRAAASNRSSHRRDESLHDPVGEGPFQPKTKKFPRCSTQWAGSLVQQPVAHAAADGSTQSLHVIHQ